MARRKVLRKRQRGGHRREDQPVVWDRDRHRRQDDREPTGGRRGRSRFGLTDDQVAREVWSSESGVGEREDGSFPGQVGFPQDPTKAGAEGRNRGEIPPRFRPSAHSASAFLSTSASIP